jgi:hypothetical protein
VGPFFRTAGAPCARLEGIPHVAASLGRAAPRVPLRRLPRACRAADALAAMIVTRVVGDARFSGEDEPKRQVEHDAMPRSKIASGSPARQHRSCIIDRSSRSNSPLRAEVAELADALASGASCRKAVEVQILSSAPIFIGGGPCTPPGSRRSAGASPPAPLCSLLNRRGPLHPAWLTPLRSHFAACAVPFAHLSAWPPLGRSRGEDAHECHSVPRLRRESPPLGTSDRRAVLGCP